MYPWQRSARHSEALDEGDKNEAELALMHTGRRYVEIPVLVKGKGKWKGTRGTVVGDYDSPERAARLKKLRQRGKDNRWLDQQGILLTIQKWGSLQTIENIPVEQVYHELYVHLFFPQSSEILTRLLF